MVKCHCIQRAGGAPRRRRGVERGRRGCRRSAVSQID